MLYSIWIYYLIHLFYKMCLCARRSLNGCSAERLSQWSQLSSHATLLNYAANQSGDHKRGQLSPSEKKNDPKDSTVDVLECLVVSFTFGVFCTENASSSQCPLGKSDKKGTSRVKGMKVWLKGEITHSRSQSARVRNNLKLVCCLTRTDNATTHQCKLPAEQKQHSVSAAAAKGRVQISSIDRRLWHSQGGIGHGDRKKRLLTVGKVSETNKPSEFKSPALLWLDAGLNLKIWARGDKDAHHHRRFWTHL